MVKLVDLIDFIHYNKFNLDSSYTIIVPDGDVLTKLCGTNDSNIKLIEESLGVPVYTRGNELFVDEQDPDIQRRFRFIIDRIIDEIEDGTADCEDAVASILNTKPREGSQKNAIDIPGGRRVYPKTQNQSDYVELMRKRDMVLCAGPAGTGKTYLAVAEALRLVLTKKASGIVLTRPVVEAGETLGCLPGDMEEKISPYLRPLYDTMESILPRSTVHRLIENGIIESAPLAYMRGRTISEKVLILDEAQNTTCTQMKMFLTRIGNSSKVFVTGDTTQIDLPRRVESGFVQALRILPKIQEIGIMEMSGADVVRNPLVKKIIQAYGKDTEK